MGKAWPVMLVGNAGTGKSVLMGDKLESLGTDDYLVQAVPFNFYTTSAMLQGRRAWLHPHISAQPHSLSPPPTVPMEAPERCPGQTLQWWSVRVTEGPRGGWSS